MKRLLLGTDRRLYLFLHRRVRASWLDPVMVTATAAGTKGAVWLALAAIVFLTTFHRAHEAALWSVAALTLAEAVVNLVLKPLVRRERPFRRHRRVRVLVRLPGPHSWPSAHAASSAAAAVVLTGWFPLISVGALPLAALIAYSRVYVGVHYPMDVVAGSVIGALVGGLVLAVAYFTGHAL